MTPLRHSRSTALRIRRVVLVERERDVGDRDVVRADLPGQPLEAVGEQVRVELALGLVAARLAGVVDADVDDLRPGRDADRLPVLARLARDHAGDGGAVRVGELGAAGEGLARDHVERVAVVHAGVDDRDVRAARPGRCRGRAGSAARAPPPAARAAGSRRRPARRPGRAAPPCRPSRWCRRTPARPRRRGPTTRTRRRRGPASLARGGSVLGVDRRAERGVRRRARRRPRTARPSCPAPPRRGSRRSRAARPRSRR